MKEPFFSIVMPVYGVEKYLERAVNSVLNQTYQNFELILVDDKSPDRCGEICDKIENMHINVKVIHHEENKGLSAARNTGIKYATGQYIWFMDSDDYVQKTLLEKVYDSLEENMADVVIFGLREQYYDKNGELKNQVDVLMPEEYLRTEDSVRNKIMELEEKTLYGYAWNKVYNLDYLKKIGIKYENVTLIEDIVFNIKYFENIGKANIIGECLYYYEKRMGSSLTGKYVKDYFVLHRRRVYMLYEQQERWGTLSDNNAKEILGKIYCRYIYSAIQRNLDKRANMNLKKRYLWIKKVFADDLFEKLIPYAKADNMQQKIMLYMLKNRRIFGSLGIGRIINLVKSKMPIFFAIIK